MNNNTKKETADKLVKTHENRLFTWFIGIIFLVLIFFGIITYINFSEAKDYREKIISNQSESLSLAEQKIEAIYKLDSVIAISQSRLDTTKSDSLKSNRDSLLYINYIISHREELKRSSDALKQELDATAKETKSMIDIHLQYIDQQYSTLSLWAGIITIVFLIFSFYAVFKQEDAINKAYTIIDDLNNKLLGLDESVKSKMRKLEEDSNSIIQNIESKALSGVNKIIQEADKQRKINQLTTEADDYRKEEKYELALQKIDEAINIDSENDYLYYMKAYIAHKLANYELAIECYKKSSKINPDNYWMFNNWGATLADLARINNDEKLFTESLEKFKKANEIYPKDDSILNNWGAALSELAKLKNDSRLYLESIEKFKKASRINAKSENISKNLGATLLALAQLKKDLKSYKDEIESILLKAEAIKEGAGSYNLACLYSLLDQKDVALTWFEKSLRFNNPGKEHISTDPDFNNIKSDPQFNELLAKYFPEK